MLIFVFVNVLPTRMPKIYISCNVARIANQTSDVFPLLISLLSDKDLFTRSLYWDLTSEYQLRRITHYVKFQTRVYIKEPPMIVLLTYFQNGFDSTAIWTTNSSVQ